MVAGAGEAAYRFAGRRLDSETGLYHNRARAYSPSLGRFLQPDPIGVADNINLYAYTGNDPVNATDPSGRCPNCVAATAGAIGGAAVDLGIQLYSNGGSISKVDWNSVGTSAAVGAGVSAFGPTGALLGRGGTKAAKFGYSKFAGLLNSGNIRFGWTYNAGKSADVLSLRIGGMHLDVPGSAITAGARPARDGIVAGTTGGLANSAVSDKNFLK
jgi:RHS repeat-associated protein